TREAVQEVQHGVAAPRLRAIPGRQVDVRLLAPAAECGARNGDRLRGPRLRDEGGLPRRVEAAVAEEIAEIAVRADEPHGEKPGEHRRGRRPLDARRDHLRYVRSGTLSAHCALIT